MQGTEKNLMRREIGVRHAGPGTTGPAAPGERRDIRGRNRMRFFAVDRAANKPRPLA